MLPQSHITYTVSAFNLASKWIPSLKKVDYRFVVLAATLPDLIDKPLAALYFYRRYKSAMLFAHTLLFHMLVFITTLWKKPHWLPYVLAFHGHVVLDRIWFFPDTLYWPLRGGRFHVWTKQGSEQQNIKMAYWYTFTKRPELWGWEIGGIIAGLWFIFTNRLYQSEKLADFLRTGKLY